MQRERSSLNSFPEPIDLNQRSYPETTSIGDSLSWDHMLNPIENQLPSHMVANSEANITHMDVSSEYAPRFSGWEHGEPSSRTNNAHGRHMVANSEANITHMDVSSEYAPRFSGWEHGETSSRTNNAHGQHESSLRLGRSSFRLLSGSDAHLQEWPSDPSNINVYGRSPFFENHSSNISSSYSSHSQSDYVPSLCASSSALGILSSTSTLYSENNGSGPGSSFSTWGSSCKRKALEGSNGGSSTSSQQMEKLNVSSGCLNLSLNNQPQQINQNVEFGLSGVAHGFYQSSNISRIDEVPAGSSIPISRHGHHNSVRFNAPKDARPFGNISRASSSQTNPINSVNHSHLMHMDEARVMQPFPCTESGPRSGDVSVRTSQRTNHDYNMAASSPEMLQDHVDWSFTPGTSSLSSRNQNHPSGSRVRPISRARSSAVWLPHQSQTPQNHHRLSEVAPWIHYAELESEIQRSHHYYPSSISSDGGASSSLAQHWLEHRSVPPSLNIDDEDAFRALSAVEGRHRLIRHVLNAMRRGSHLQAEDYMLIDPFLSGSAEFHDRHRDMRLDVDNMSYEELLALEERIGNVNTGVSEEIIKKKLKCRKQETNHFAHIVEPCCICQENYGPGDDIGILDCGHEFHTDCIKQWLILKNICPICKLTALGS